MTTTTKTPVHELMSTDTLTLETLVQAIRAKSALLTSADNAELLVDLSLKQRGGKSRTIMALDKSDSAQAHGKAARAIYIHISALADVEALIESLLIEVPKAVYAACSVRKLGKPVERALKKLGFEVKTNSTGKLIIKSTDKTDELIVELTQGLSFVCKPLAEEQTEKLRLKELETLKGKDSKPESDTETPETSETPETPEKQTKKPSPTNLSAMEHCESLGKMVVQGKVSLEQVNQWIQDAMDAAVEAVQAAEAAAEKDLDLEEAA